MNAHVNPGQNAPTAATTPPTAELARQLSEWLNGTDISLLELSGPGQAIVLRREGAPAAPARAAAPAAAPVAEPQAAPRTVVRAGGVGIVLHAHPLRQEPLVRVGQAVSAGQPLALLKVGKVLLPVAAPRAGTVTRFVAEDQSVAGYGAPLVEIE